MGGTSVSAPIIAGVYALAGSATAGTNPASYPYAHPADFTDVTSGSNGTCTSAYLCTGVLGYDGPTGRGTPIGPNGLTPGNLEPSTPGTIAFQANNGYLYLAEPGGPVNLSQGMMPGTSPSITPLPGGGTEEAFQANNGYLYVYGTSGSLNTNLAMKAGTSPSIATTPAGGFEVAFQHRQPVHVQQCDRDRQSQPGHDDGYQPEHHRAVQRHL